MPGTITVVIDIKLDVKPDVGKLVERLTQRPLTASRDTRSDTSEHLPWQGSAWCELEGSHWRRGDT